MGSGLEPGAAGDGAAEPERRQGHHHEQGGQGGRPAAHVVGRVAAPRVWHQIKLRRNTIVFAFDRKEMLIGKLNALLTLV